MKKSLLLFPIFIFLLSCQKQTQTSIVGGWLEVSAYAESSGQYSWGPAAKFPLKLWFNADGTYSAFNDVPAGRGNYSFDYSTSKLKFESVNSPIRVYTVSHLSDGYLIIDYAADYKLKFLRL